MLTPTDIHYLVGLLTSNATGEDVEIELGDMVFDISAEKERDVDVTVTKRLVDGTSELYQAYEIKDHSKPLDVIHVEQLCAKMADMPAIKNKYIVSSSGYTEPAKLKAAKHNVQLLEIVEWGDTTKGFEFWQTSKEYYEFADIYYKWPECNVIYNFDIREPTFASQPINDNTSICGDNDRSFPNAKVLKDLTPFIFNQMRIVWGESELAKEMATDSSMKVKQNISLQEQTFLRIDDKRIRIKDADFYAVVTKTKLNHDGEFKALRKVGELTPISGCAIFINKDGHLAGIAISNVDQRKSLICVPYEDRIKRIFKHRLKRN